LRHPLTRTSEATGALEAYDSSAAFRFEVPKNEFAAAGVGTSNRRH
jgi:hypothetical protein